MFEVGRLCIKLAGRDAGQKCVVVDVLKGKYVLIDGMTRRKKCNTIHLEPLDETLEIKKNAPHEDVVNAFKGLGHEVKITTPKTKMTRLEATRHQLTKAASKTPTVKSEKAKTKKEAKKKDVKKTPAKKTEAKAE